MTELFPTLVFPTLDEVRENRTCPFCGGSVELLDTEAGTTLRHISKAGDECCIKLTFPPEKEPDHD